MDLQKQRIEELDAVVSQFDLNKHPFYQDWRNGTLPYSKLQSYATQYAHFVGTIDEGWDQLGETHYAEEERVHETLWENFRSELNATQDAPNAATATLVSAAKNAFTSAPGAMGGLYAFEAQQPNTSRSKLEGLVEHYATSEKGREYFAVHADDFAEAETLRVYVSKISDADFAKTKSACTVVCAAMWQALDSVYYS